MLTKVRLKGRLGQEFGEVWELNVRTPKEAFHALNMNTDGRFLRYIDETSRTKQINYGVRVGNLIVNKENTVLLEGPHGSKEEIVVYPILGGSGGITTAIIIDLVVSLITAVISSLLAPSPNVDLGSNNDTARKDSYLFSGGPQPAKQGKPVPVGYGRMIVSPMSISVQYEYNNVGQGTPPAAFVSGGGGNYNDWGHAGGYFNYDQNSVDVARNGTTN